MHWKKNWYLVHRWIGLVVSLQPLAWSVGGFTFSILDIENVRGELDMRRDAEAALELDTVRVSPREAIESFSRGLGLSTAVHKAVLRERRGHIVYELFGVNGEPLASVDVSNGDVTQRISER